MRYDTPIYFESVSPGGYDEETGNYGEPEIHRARRLASVISTSEDRMMLVYGSIRAGSVTVSLPVAYTDSFDRIRIGRKAYKVDWERTLRRKQVFVVSEIQERQKDVEDSSQAGGI